MRTFSTMTAARLALADGRWAAGCTPSAMERTGVSWRPVFNRLEEHLTALVVNAHPIKAVPGRKTDVRACEWRCELWRHGLLQGRGMPPRPSREWRELPRHRPLWGRDRGAVAHRSRKRLASANIQLGHVAAQVLGLSGRVRLRALADGAEDAAQLAPLAQGKLKAKAAQRKPSRTGHWRPTQRCPRHAL